MQPDVTQVCFHQQQQLAPAFLSRENLLALPTDQLREAVTWLDITSFALAAACSCRCLWRLINSESFEGWLHEIRRLHSVCPWRQKVSMLRIAETDQDIQLAHYRTALQSLDVDFILSGQKIISKSLRQPGKVAIPKFFDCFDTMVYSCKDCHSFISPVDSTVGRGSMGFNKAALILQPAASWPFVCGILDAREARLTSGTYMLMDLCCPNSNCNTSLGWLYLECMANSDDDEESVPDENHHKIGQYWMFAESLRVDSPAGGMPGCSGEYFYMISSF
eukprot:TRINITY_DN72795_c0_g1_i1.p1 TRINITY_DN72795_c0_g1~~TRINITY_DN72795_c0_g1_i1.p1  ORF type:complete len:277 (-),score=44.46 TRINITY_DN72795_c0_g1_i1:92-922(-)